MNGDAKHYNIINLSGYLDPILRNKKEFCTTSQVSPPF